MISNKLPKNQENVDSVLSSEKETKISEMAYYKAESRGFEPGRELDDWFEAERELFSIMI